MPSPLQVRAAVHSGVVHERDGDLFGPPLNRAARLVDRCAPGGVLVSDATVSLLAGRRPTGLELESLGSVQLRGLQEPEAVSALTGAGLVAADHDVGAERAVAGNVPPVESELVGRLDDLRSLMNALEVSPLVTVVGVGGMGKTRLALEAATLVADRFVDGVWWCDLTVATHGDAVGAVVLDGLRIRQVAGRTAVRSVTDFLAGTRSLVVLDNCEHVIDAVRALVGAIRSECPNVHVLMTSREALGLRGESSVPVSSLPVDDGVDLFFERALEVRPDFVRNDDRTDAVRSVCTRLDGIPLAIELAAARCRVMSIGEVGQRLSERFKLLRGGRGNVDRHRTLLAAVAWSHSLLDDDERDVFDRMAVFAGGAMLDAIAAVVERDEYEVLDIVDRLVARSMAVVIDTPLGSRYRLLETLRQFAEDRLLERAATADVQNAHLQWVVRLACDARASWMTAGEVPAMRRHVAELDNIRAAVAYALDAERLDDAASVLAGFGEAAVLCGWHQINDWVDASSFDPARNDDHIDAVAFLSQLALFGGDSARAVDYLELVAHITDADASLDLIGARLYSTLWVQQDVAGGLALLERWERDNPRTAGNRPRANVAHASFTLQAFAAAGPDGGIDPAVLDAALRAGIAALDEARRAGCDIWAALLLQMLSSVCLVTGDTDRARGYAVECMGIAETFPESGLLREMSRATFVNALFSTADGSVQEPGEALRLIRGGLEAAIGDGGWFAALVLAASGLPILAGRPECDELLLVCLVGSRTFAVLRTQQEELVGSQRAAELAAEAQGLNIVEAARRALAALDRAIESEDRSQQ